MGVFPRRAEETPVALPQRHCGRVNRGTAFTSKAPGSCSLTIQGRDGACRMGLAATARELFPLSRTYSDEIRVGTCARAGGAAGRATTSFNDAKGVSADGTIQSIDRPVPRPRRWRIDWICSTRLEIALNRRRECACDRSGDR